MQTSISAALATGSVLLPTSAYTSWLIIDPVSTESSILEFVKLGLGGLIVFAVTKPLLSFVLKRLESTQDQTERLLVTLKESVDASIKNSQTMAATYLEEREVHKALSDTQEKMLHVLESLMSKVSQQALLKTQERMMEVLSDIADRLNTIDPSKPNNKPH